MTQLVTKRKKYVREMTATWWKGSDFYKRYMLREATALATIWFCILLFLIMNTLTGERDLASIGLLSLPSIHNLLTNPIVVILNIISFAALLFHAFTLFSMTGEVMAGKVGIPADKIRKALIIAFAVVSLIILILAVWRV